MPQGIPGGGGGSEPIIAFVSVKQTLNGSGTGHATDPTTQWLYTFTEALLNGDGYNYWIEEEAGLTGDCRNLYEAPNYAITAASPAGTLGIGITLASLDYNGDGTYEFYLTPPVVTVPMMLWPVRLTNGTITWWFAHPNQIGGGC